MAERKTKYDDCTYDATNPNGNHWYVVPSPLGNFIWKVLFADGRRESGHEAFELDAKAKAREVASQKTTSRPAVVERLGSFARHHAPTKSSRYGTIEPRPTYGDRDFKHGELHLCAHGQRTVLCPRCGGRLCVCTGQPKHECSRAA
jgi:hypothetical protein